MVDWKHYFHQPKKVDELIKTAVVVVDTNVLLSAYQWRNVTVDEVLKVLDDLSKKERLKIPFQVVKEFSKNRPNVLKERLNEIEGTINELKRQKPLNERVPMLEGSEIYNETEKMITSYNNSVENLKKGLIEIREKVRDLFYNDPYLVRLNSILERSFYSPEESEGQLKELAKKRFEDKQPPGYKDNSKEENSEGDFIIWHTILQLKKDVIFISNDKKVDWVYTDNHKNPISARRELVEEFYKVTEGKDFVHMSPKEFISLYNPGVSQDVKNDLIKFSWNNFRKKNHTVSKINKILIKYDPFQIILDDGAQEDKYMSEAKDIVNMFNSLENTNGLASSIVEVLNYSSQIMISVDDILDMIDEIEHILLGGNITVESLLSSLS